MQYAIFSLVFYFINVSFKIISSLRVSYSFLLYSPFSPNFFQIHAPIPVNSIFCPPLLKKILKWLISAAQMFLDVRFSTGQLLTFQGLHF